MRVAEKLAELRKKHADELAGARAILDLARKESRGLTKDEESKYDSHTAEAKRLKDEIDRLPTRDAPLLDIGGQGRTSSAPLRLRTSDGREVRALEPGDRLADVPEVRSALPDGIRADELDFGRLIRAVAVGDWHGAEAEKRAMAVGDLTGGGFLIPDLMGAQVIDLARNQAQVMRAGARTIPMESNTLTFAKVTGDPAVAWKAENAQAPFTEGTLGAVKLVTKTLMGVASASVELVEDSMNAGQLIQDLLSRSMALKLDLSALRGAGSAIEPTGIRFTSGVQLTELGSGDGASLSDYNDLAAAVQNIWDVNGPQGGLAAIYSSREAGTFDRLQDTTNQPLQPPPSVAGLRTFVSNQIPVNLTTGTSTDTSEIYVGDFPQLFVGMRTALRVEVSREASDASASAFKNLQVWIRAYMRADVVAVRPDHFVVIHGVRP